MNLCWHNAVNAVIASKRWRTNSRPSLKVQQIITSDWVVSTFRIRRLHSAIFILAWLVSSLIVYQWYTTLNITFGSEDQAEQWKETQDLSEPHIYGTIKDDADDYQAWKTMLNEYFRPQKHTHLAVYKFCKATQGKTDLYFQFCLV